MKCNWLLVALCALLTAGNILADADIEVSNVSASANKENLNVLPAMMVDNSDDDDMDAEKMKHTIDEFNDMQNPDAKFEVMEAIKDLSGKDAEVMNQPGMQRLARELNYFHERQKVQRVRQAVGLKHFNEDEEDEQEAIAEERAIRRRKRVRRRNSNNKVKRTQQNNQSVKRRNTSRRQSPNRNNVKRKNVQNANRKNNRRPSSSKRRNNNNGKNGIRKSGKRQSNRNQSVRNSKRKASSSRTNNKNKRNRNRNKKQKRVNKIENENNMAREDHNQGLDAAPAA